MSNTAKNKVTKTKTIATPVANGLFEITTETPIEQPLEGNFSVYGNTYNVGKLTESQCKYLVSKGYKRIRPVAAVPEGNS